MLKTTRIFIPTLGRPFNQVTLSCLSAATIKKHVTMVVDQDEVDTWQESMKRKIYPPMLLLVTPPKVKGIAAKRQYITDYAVGENVPRFIMMDDDLIFAHRRDVTQTKLTPSLPQNVDLMLENLEKRLQHYYSAGISARFGNQNKPPTVGEPVQRQTNVHAFRTSLFREHGITWDVGGPTYSMEDFDVTLQMFTLGIPNYVFTQHTFDQKGSNTAGGCARFRTLETQEASARTLAKRFPEFVTVVEKETKGEWFKGSGGKRYDVRVQWRKAYEFGHALHG